MPLLQSGKGKIICFSDFTGDEVPVANTVQNPTTLSGGLRLIGEGNNADDGLVTLSALNGVGRLTTTNEDTEGQAAATAICFDPGKNGPLVLEARVSMQVQTARNVFIGFGGVAGGVLTHVVTGGTATITYVSTTGDNVAGFVFDSQLDSKNWHIVYKGGTASEPTTTTLCDSGTLPVNGEFDLLRVTILPNGTAEFLVNGDFPDLSKRVTGAVSTTVNVAGICGVWATASTIADLDVDFFEVSGNRYWDRTNA